MTSQRPLQPSAATLQQAPRHQHLAPQPNQVDQSRLTRRYLRSVARRNGLPVALAVLADLVSGSAVAR